MRKKYEKINKIEDNVKTLNKIRKGKEN